MLFDAEAETFRKAGIRIGLDRAEEEEALLFESLSQFGIQRRNDALEMARLYAVLHAFADCEIIAHTRATLDITGIDAVMRAVEDASPDLIINCAAFNHVDEAESRQTEAFAVNALAVRTLGTFLGATYADLFPQNVGRFVLDGVLDPALTAEQINLGQAQGFEQATRSFVADCARNSDCPLGSTVPLRSSQSTE